MKRLALLAVTAALVLAGCAARSTVQPGADSPTSTLESSVGSSISDAAESSTATDPSTESSAGAETGPIGLFRAESSIGHDIVPGSTIAIGFDGSQLTVRAGCNSMGGDYTIEGGWLQVNNLSQTEMACDQPLMDQDSWVAAFLMSGPYVSIDGETLNLAGRGIVAEGLTLTLVPEEPARPLVGTRWQLDTILDGETASSVPAAADVVLELTADHILIQTGCNTISGAAVVNLGVVELGPLASTKVGCSPEVSALEALLTAHLTGTVPYFLDGATLRFDGPADGRSLVFREYVVPPPSDTTAEQTTAAEPTVETTPTS